MNQGSDKRRKNILSTVRIIPLLIIAALSCRAEKETPQKMYVRIQPGLMLRSNATVKSKALVRMGFGHEVEVFGGKGPVETLLGVKGVWQKIRYSHPDTIKSYEGWAFGPFILSKETVKTFRVKNGKAIVADKVKAYWKDPATGYYWMQCNYGQSFKQGVCHGLSSKTHSEAGFNYCKQFKYEGRRWFVPVVDEYKTLLPGTKFFARFPYSESGEYASESDMFNGSETYFLGIRFPGGETEDFGDNGFIKCVSTDRKKSIYGTYE